MTSYKDWNLRSKIIFAALAPFVLAIVILAPFITNKAIISIEENAKTYVDELAYSASLEILGDLEKAQRELLVLSQVLEGIVTSDNPDRATVNKILKSVAEKNQSLLGVWTVWEQNSFDGKDALFANTIAHDATGRFIPYWTKESGALQLRALRHYNDEKMGNYHSLSKQTNREIMLAPYSYKIKDQPSTITTISHPIFSQSGKFLGTVGVDIILNSLQEAIAEIKPLDIGNVGVISNEGVFIANTDTTQNGVKIDISPSKLEYIRSKISTGDLFSDEVYDKKFKENIYRVVTPINLPTVNNNWALVVDIPLSPIKERLYMDLIFITFVVLLCLCIGLSVAVITAKNISTPITQISEALDKISLGNTAVKIPDINTNDEVGMMCSSAYVFKQHAIDLINAKQEAERANKAKTDFLSSMSHELRTPMHAILGYSKLGLEKVEDKESKIFRYFTNISNSGERLLSLLNDLLDLSKMESGMMQFNFEKKDIRDCVDNAIAEVKSLFDKQAINLVVNCNTKETIAEFDFNKITQVVINLLSNALKFSKEGDEVQVNIDEGRVDIDSEIVPAIHITVIDKGVGIPESELEQVFEKFVQGTTNICKTGGGTGLGLSISRMIVKNHKGKLYAKNNEAEGVTLHLLLPNKILGSHE